jgi:hypothetical protein
MKLSPYLSVIKQEVLLLGCWYGCSFQRDTIGSEHIVEYKNMGIYE